jgi:uncharacterized protein
MFDDIARDLETGGVAVVRGLLTAEECAQVRDLFDDEACFRSTIDMARHSFGRGRYRYFADPLPPLVAQLREELYPPLADVAEGWAERLGERTPALHTSTHHLLGDADGCAEPAGRPGADRGVADGCAEPRRWPATHAELVAECAAAGQRRPTPLLLKYGPGDHNRLHQDVYGDLTFPLQLLVMLSRPEVDFTGGESVFVEQRPRQQSLPRVLRPGLGDAVVFPVHHRPERGSRGDHRVQVRHGVSEVHTGERFVLGVIFHNAP